MRLVGLAVLAIGSVQLCGAALALMSTSSDECPSVVDTNVGRGIDYECSSDGGQSKESAVLVLAALGLFFGAGAVYLLAGLLPRRRAGGAEAEVVDDLIDDLAELDDLHERGLLTEEELDAARTRRLRQDGG